MPQCCLGCDRLFIYLKKNITMSTCTNQLLSFGIIGSIGFPLNLMSAVCFSRLYLEADHASKRQQSGTSSVGSSISNMLLCLLLKSILDTLCSCINLASLAFLQIYTSYAFSIYQIYFLDISLYILGKLLLIINFIH